MFVKLPIYGFINADFCVIELKDNIIVFIRRQ